MKLFLYLYFTELFTPLPLNVCQGSVHALHQQQDEEEEDLYHSTKF